MDRNQGYCATASTILNSITLSNEENDRIAKITQRGRQRIDCLESPTAGGSKQRERTAKYRRGNDDSNQDCKRQGQG